MESKSPPAAKEALAPEAFVVRFGLMRVADLREAIVRCYRTLGFYGLSVYGENRLSPEEIANLAKKPHSQMRKSQVAKLRTLGLEVERRGRFPHIALIFSAEPSDEGLKKVVGVFDDPEPNPHPVK